MSISDSGNAVHSAQISVRAPLPNVEITLFGSDLVPVASGVGHVTSRVPPGIYQIEYRAGSSVEQELVCVAEGEHVQRGVPSDVTLITPAPILGTPSASLAHTTAATTLSAMPRPADRGEAQLVLMVRNLDGNSTHRRAAPITRHAVADIELVRAESRERVKQVVAAIQVDDTTGWAGYALTLRSGMYFLRSKTASTDGHESDTFDQSLYLARGWQTLLFVPNTSAGPALHRASIHMTPSGVVWDGKDADIQRSSAALELALSGLQQGRNVITGEILEILLGMKFQNPMLGIVGAHSMLLKREPDRDAFRQVVARLNDLVPDHPDVLVLSWLAEQSDTGASGRRTLSHPPMLAASYNAALKRDVKCGRGIEPESLAEKVAPFVLKLGPWMTWRPIAVDASEEEIDLAYLRTTIAKSAVAEALKQLKGSFPATVDMPTIHGRGAEDADAGVGGAPDMKHRGLIRIAEPSPEVALPGKVELARRAITEHVWGTVASLPGTQAKNFGQRHLAGELRRRVIEALTPSSHTDPATVRVVNYLKGVVEDAAPAEIASLAHGFDAQMLSQISANTGLPTSVVRRSAPELENTIASLAPRGLL